jgi:molybdopterin-containing oxidoreductase family membrane subunit
MASDKQNLINEFTPNLEKPSLKWYLWVGFLTILVLWGVYALVMQIVKGQVITGMRDHAVWGIYTANFIFFMGLTYAGALISCTFQLLRIQWGKSITRIAELLTVSALFVGAPFILFCLGRLDRIHFLFTNGRIQSPITWDVIAIVTDMVFCLAFLYFTYITDFAKLRDHQNLNVANWRKKLYGFLSLGYKGTPEQKKSLKLAKDIMAAIIIPTAIIAYSLLSWLFGMSLRPGWHSTIFGPYFVVTAVYSGLALLIVIMWIYRKTRNLDIYITKDHFNRLGLFLLLMGLFYGYFSFSEYITEWYNLTKPYAKLWDKLVSLESYGWLSLFHVIFGLGLPIIILAIPKLRTINSITAVSVFIVLALWVKRYLIVVPVLETPFIPIQDTRPEYIQYSMSWVEIALTVAGIALMVLIFTLASKFAPIMPITELEEVEEDVQMNVSLKPEGA